ncbi:MAG: 50S ribosomal protein L5 [Candidatus Nanohaloarchaea archaeon]
MKKIHVSKVVVNIGEGEVGESVDKAEKLLKKLTGREPVRTESGRGAKTFGKRAGLNIGTMVTLRGEEAREFIDRVAPAAGEIDEGSFDGNGNFSFGVGEYIDVPGVDYDSDIGMKGFEVAVSLERPGYRVKRRDHKPSEVGRQHRVSDREAREFVDSELDLKVKQ